MRTSLSLGLAIATGLAAVLLVAADVTWSTSATLEGQFEGEWISLADSEQRNERHGHFLENPCPIESARLTLRNPAPYPVSRGVEVWLQGAGPSTLVLDEKIRLGPGDAKTIVLDLPELNATRDDWPGALMVNIRSIDLELYATTCHMPPKAVPA